MKTIDLYTDAAWNHFDKETTYRQAILLLDGEIESIHKSTQDIKQSQIWGIEKFDITAGEMMVIIRALEIILQKAYTDSQFNIYTDSEVTYAIFNGLGKSKKYKALMKTYQKLCKKVISGGNTIELRWIPGHDGVWGNEKVNQACKQTKACREKKRMLAAISEASKKALEPLLSNETEKIF